MLSFFFNFFFFWYAFGSAPLAPMLEVFISSGLSSLILLVLSFFTFFFFVLLINSKSDLRPSYPFSFFFSTGDGIVEAGYCSFLAPSLVSFVISLLGLFPIGPPDILLFSLIILFNFFLKLTLCPCLPSTDNSGYSDEVNFIFITP